ncbi:hypothetical protein C8Q69DRAFT_468409 [Paecilomyces variotii]|uniref:C2H2-type domain-containing protein n=1 Tax=Byssochlamys spectabilis TaxID=264951 RepID=A0A443HT56_BYSSP|nr:hypothetical protein C8Q69DRAFT_468409 [Paecilomyces variotii]RWQ94964.1 hypothetical protein C8Q69DRAFT_468409 [Paecilomyces variotii]
MSLWSDSSYGDDDYYWCPPCQRFFNSQYALDCHRKSSSRHEWCARCRRYFSTPSAKAAHIRDSAAHNVCWKCPVPLDFISYDQLQTHRVSDHHLCRPCGIYHCSSDELRDHNVEQHNLCVDCGQFFQNRNNLEMHKQRHTPRDLECYGHDRYGCEQVFKTFSGMLIHLESGSCISGTIEGEIDDLARACYQSRKYRRDLENGGWLYMCPGCERGFSKLSSLFQHAESIQSCSSYTTGNGCLAKLRYFISWRI